MIGGLGLVMKERKKEKKVEKTNIVHFIRRENANVK